MSIAVPPAPSTPTPVHGAATAAPGTATRVHGAALDAIPPVGLEELTCRAGLMTRRDRKYLVPVAAVPALLVPLQDRVRVLQIDGRRWFGYRSTYFDTPQLTSFELAARRRPRRFKVRTRTYVDTASTWLEVKVRDRSGHTTKTRMPWPTGGSGLPRPGRGFVADALAHTVGRPEDLADVLGPELTTTYRRATLLLPDEAARVTVDLDLAATHRLGYALRTHGLAVVETKTAGRACQADRTLWALGHRPIALSKYATTLAALHPELPAHRWNPALRRLGAAALPPRTPTTA